MTKCILYHSKIRLKQKLEQLNFNFLNEGSKAIPLTKFELLIMSITQKLDLHIYQQ
jgi:hypothetical protein